MIPSYFLTITNFNNMKLFITIFTFVLLIASIFVGASHFQSAGSTINVESAIQSHKPLIFNYVAADSSVIEDTYTIVLFPFKVIMDGDTYNGSWKQDTFVERGNAFKLVVFNQQIEMYWPDDNVWYFYNN